MVKSAKTRKPLPTSIKVRLSIFAIVAALIAGVMYFSSLYQEEVERKTPIEANYSKLLSEIQMSESQSKSLAAEIDSTGKTLSGSFMSKDEFISFIGSTAQQVGVGLNKYSGGNIVDADGIITMNFKFEIVGTLEQLQQLVSNIDYLGTPYAINSISTRKSDNYIWLDRDINKTVVLDWWDGKSLIVPRTGVTSTAIEPIGIRDVMQGDTLKMYLDISFISSTKLEELGTLSSTEEDTEIEDVPVAPSVVPPESNMDSAVADDIPEKYLNDDYWNRTGEFAPQDPNTSVISGDSSSESDSSSEASQAEVSQTETPQDRISAVPPIYKLPEVSESSAAVVEDEFSDYYK